jgi:hypothetical protein
MFLDQFDTKFSFDATWKLQDMTTGMTMIDADETLGLFS